jgi:hypothetical protein
LACGRRFGKTTLGLILLILVALEGYPVGWFSPTNKMLADPWRDALRLLRPLIKTKNSTDHRIELINGAVIEFWSLENYDSIRGRKYKRVVIDEAAMVAALEDAWNAVIRPTLTDYRGDAYFLSTPKGANFFKRIFDWGQDVLARPEWQSWQMPTITNPHINPVEVESARQDIPEAIFTQEYLAQFLEAPGGVFHHVRECAILERPLAPYPGVFIAGVDWGKTNDFTVISVLDVSKRQQVELTRFNKIDWAFQRERLTAVATAWGINQIIAEANSIGGPNIEALQRKGMPVTAFDMTGTSKSPTIESLVLAIEQREILLLNDPVLVAELEAYERYVNPKTGRSRYSAPEGMHDDTVIATALALWGIVNARVGVPIAGGTRITPSAMGNVNSSSNRPSPLPNTRNYGNGRIM